MTPKALSREKLCGICNKKFKGIKYCEQKKELMEEIRLNCFLVDDVDNQRRDVPCIEYVKLKDIIENHD